MGDRCYMTLKIGGEIKSVKDLAEVLRALEADGARAESNGGSSRQSLEEEILSSAAAGNQADFSFEEVNYASLDCFEPIAELSLDLIAWNDSGDDYGAGNLTYNATTEETHNWEDENTNSLDLDALLPILDSEGDDSAKIAEIRSLLDAKKTEQWSDIRPLTFAPGVREAWAQAKNAGSRAAKLQQIADAETLAAKLRAEIQN